MAVGEALFRRCGGGDLCAHRIADELLTLGEGTREAGEEAARIARQDAVGHAGRAILFVHQQREAV
ncbi:hypothetical protein, partial [Klebsiella pneumoniae]|uniref:hypothetical protein n=1 Tax=Klebsiella pneumoniae TaxID=573 RepID=UPI00197C2FAF